MYLVYKCTEYSVVLVSEGENMEPIKGNRIERKKEETKKKIIAVAMDLFHKHGFDQTTIDQIAMEVDIAKGTIYNHFSVKEAIISEYIYRTFKEETPALTHLLQQLPDTRSRLISLFRKSLEWVEFEFDKNLYKKYFAYRMQTFEQSFRGQSLRSGFNIILGQIIDMGQQAEEIRKDVPTEVLAHQLESIHSFMVAAWLAIPESFSVEERITWNVDLFINGAKEQGEKRITKS
ncbi:MAG: TetR/AcrR family transcriptional regulator [Firmicutes bacterium]|nr:TetR/AcrR family transcriptional regulator [Bacillota bacterium]